MSGALHAALVAAAAEGPEPNARRWRRFVDPGERPVEIQALRVPGPHGGEVNLYAHARTTEEYVQRTLQMEQYAPQAVYAIPNVINPAAVAAREQGGRTPAGLFWPMEKGGSTRDVDVVARSVLYVDFDSERAPNTSATEEELAEVCAVVERAYADLAALVGYDAMAVGCSGNGCALFVALDHLPEKH